jgi:uncharacterized protein
MRFKFYAFKILVVCVIIFIMQNLFSSFTNLFILNSDSFPQVWRFLTAIFLHGSLSHIIYNMFALLMFGSILEYIIGGKRFLFVFFSTGLLANIIGFFFYNSSLGASGAIFGIIGALVIIRPMMMIWAFGMPLPMFLAAALWVMGDLLGLYSYFIGNPISNTGYIAHLAGVFFGFIFGFLFRERRIIKNKSNFSIDNNTIKEWEDRYLLS